MKKRRLAAVLCLLVMTLSGCGQSLPEGMDKKEVTEAGEHVAELLGTGESDAVYDLFREDVAQQLSSEDVAALVPQSAGAWKEIAASEAIGRTDEDSGEEYALVMVICEFEEGRVTISAAFDQEMELIGVQVG